MYSFSQVPQFKLLVGADSTTTELRLMITTFYRFGIASFIAILVCRACVTFASPVTYEENVSGDLTDGSDPLPIFHFDVGVNVVRGTFGRDHLFNDDFDSFAFTVPAGCEMSFGQVSLIDDLGDFVRAYWQINMGAAYQNLDIPLQEFKANSPGTEILAGGLGPGVYSVSHNLIEMNYPGPFAPEATADYEFSFEIVESVPEPCLYMLFGPGIAILATYRCTRR